MRQEAEGRHFCPQLSAFKMPGFTPGCGLTVLAGGWGGNGQASSVLQPAGSQAPHPTGVKVHRSGSGISWSCAVCPRESQPERPPQPSSEPPMPYGHHISVPAPPLSTQSRLQHPRGSGCLDTLHFQSLIPLLRKHRSVWKREKPNGERNQSSQMQLIARAIANGLAVPFVK